jgi:hypothetical protein
MTIRCSIRTDWALPAGNTADTYNATKDTLAQTSHKGWQVAVYETPIGLIQANPPGYCVGVFTDNHRKNKHLLSAQYIGVDFDDCDEQAIMTHPVITRYALAVGHTPSHGQPWRTGARLRVLFVLDNPIQQTGEPDEKPVADRYKLAVQALMTQLPPGYDKQCSDGARFYFGCKDWVVISETNVLPLTVLRDWHKQEAARVENERADAPATILNLGQITAYVEKARQDELALLHAQSPGNRNNQLFLSACNLYGLVKAGALIKATTDYELTSIAQSIGLQQTAIAATLRSAWDTATPRDLSNLNTPPDPPASANLDTAPDTVPPAPPIPPQVIAKKKPSFVFSDDACDQLMDELNGEKIPQVTPLINPYNFLHKFGGFAYIMVPGKVMYAASYPGGSKTIGAETGWTAYQRQGINSVIYSPEWIDKNSQAQEMTSRAVQRKGGPDFQAQMLHKLYLVEKANGVINGAGRKLSQDALNKAIVSAIELKQMPGKLFYLDTPGLSVEKLCDEVRLTCDVAVEMGYPIQAAWFDFAQLLWLDTATTSGRIWIETAIGLIKTVCREKNLVGFVTSQMRKGDAQSAKDGDRLESDQMQFLSDQQANLVLMFVPNIVDDREVLDSNGNPRLRARIVKDSLRGPSSEFFISWDPKRLTWLDSKSSTAHEMPRIHRSNVGG